MQSDIEMMQNQLLVNQKKQNQVAALSEQLYHSLSTLHNDLIHLEDRLKYVEQIQQATVEQPEQPKQKSVALPYTVINAPGIIDPSGRHTPLSRQTDTPALMARMAQSPAPMTRKTHSPAPIVQKAQSPAPVARKAQSLDPVSMQAENPGQVSSPVEGPAPTSRPVKISASLSRQDKTPASVSQQQDEKPVPAISSKAASWAVLDQGPPLSDTDLYHEAIENLRKGNIESARKEFQEYVERSPDTGLIDNAQYWLAECFYRQNKFDLAIRHFQKVIDRYPQGNKIEAATLKLGDSYFHIGNYESSLSILKALIARYPKSSEAHLARKRVDKITSILTGPTT
ncbi:MAG: tol-pal system protein YbgF [bacterium]